MIAKIAADLIVVIHFAFIVFVIFGGFLVLKWGKVSILHIPCVLWGVLIEFRGWICPLTPLEHHFREAAGGAGYSGGFINNYLMPIIYPEGLTQGMQIALGVIVLAVNLLVYGVVLVKRANRK
jgi:Protein of Unknown function (DUF2784)